MTITQHQDVHNNSSIVCNVNVNDDTKEAPEKNDRVEVERVLLALLVVIRSLLLLIVAGSSSDELFVHLVDREERCYSLANAAGEEAPKHGDGRTVAHLSCGRIARVHVCTLCDVLLLAPYMGCCCCSHRIASHRIASE